MSKLCEATAQRKTVADRHGSGNGSGRGERTSRDAIKPAPVCVCVLYLCLDCFWSGMAQTDGLPWGWPCLVRAGFWGREFDGRPRGVKSNQNGSNRRGLAAGSAPSNLSGYLGPCACKDAPPQGSSRPWPIGHLVAGAGIPAVEAPGGVKKKSGGLPCTP